ncbi:MAG: hypothetical protein K5780_03650 [Alphaproteobacteria bacterium]|nr:hypothetical protein [Alphaproteobacteria bacterium]
MDAGAGYERTALGCAVYCQNERMVELLINAGADVNAKFHELLGGCYGCRHSVTLIMDAAERRSEKIVKLLMKAGADTSYVSPCLSQSQGCSDEMYKFT